MFGFVAVDAFDVVVVEDDDNDDDEDGDDHISDVAAVAPRLNLQLFWVVLP